ncbi:PIN domain-containing protein [Candidatus Marithioploca araucensis]|uniref:PIN domain-containing protein n=1 Tax=Candidatus Marithioploca araucensis TaxID=70273 RepID=A0ABT7VQ34_9GAMM|nr:PIN domain-containing protein [Candidatus Marithioploca araucensis]
MEQLIYLDTHAAVWLYTDKIEKFPAKTLKLIENHPIRISPMVLLELGYLHEIGRVQDSGQIVVSSLKETLDLSICDLDYLKVINVALELTWTRDPFDRIIVAQSTVNQSTLVTKDTVIRDHYPQAFWQ